MKGFLVALQFLTRIPVRIKGDLSEREIGRSAAFFPLVGVIQGAAVVLAAFPFSLIFSPDIAGGLVVVVLLATNWGFHMDGLADTADAVSVKASGDPARDRDKRLAVMKDSSVGAIGVVVIVCILLLKFLFISALLQKGITWEILGVLFLVPVFSKWAMLPVIYHGKSARDTGLGNIFITYMNSTVFSLSILLLAAVFFAVNSIIPEVTWRSTAALFLLFFIPTYLLGLFWTAFCRKKFCGQTGDTIGAVSEITEALLLAIGFLWL